MSSPVYSRSVAPTESDSPPRPLSVVELSLDSIFVILSSSVSAEDHTIKYVVGSEPIRRDCLQQSQWQLMMPIYFSGVPVAVLDSTSGSSLQEGGKFFWSQ